jgi:hypothetical protein
VLGNEVRVARVYNIGDCEARIGSKVFQNLKLTADGSTSTSTGNVPELGNFSGKVRTDTTFEIYCC